MPVLETISAREIDRYIFNRNYLLVDVRPPSEYRKMHIRGAVCIPEEYLLDRMRGLGKTVPVLYCDRGGLSMQAARSISVAPASSRPRGRTYRPCVWAHR